LPDVTGVFNLWKGFKELYRVLYSVRTKSPCKTLSGTHPVPSNKVEFAIKPLVLLRATGDTKSRNFPVTVALKFGFGKSSGGLKESRIVVVKVLVY